MNIKARHRSSYGWLVSSTVDECLQRQIAQKINNSKIEACRVNAGHYMAFKHSISFAINFQVNFGCNRFRITSDIGSKLLLAAISSRWAVQFKSEQTPFPCQVGQVVYLDLLLCTGFDSEHAVLFLCHIFTQRPMTDRKIEQSDGRGFGQQQQ